MNILWIQQQQQQLPVRSHLRGVWGGPHIGSFTLVSITTHKEADFKDPQMKRELDKIDI